MKFSRLWVISRFLNCARMMMQFRFTTVSSVPASAISAEAVMADPARQNAVTTADIILDIFMQIRFLQSA